MRLYLYTEMWINILSNNIEQYVFDNVLLENEKLLWKGKSEPEITPKAILALNGRLKITFWSIFTFIWGIISLEILGDIFEGEDLIVILVVSILPCTFTYFGIRILYLSPRKKLLKLQNTYYGITDRRILIMEFSNKIKIVPIHLNDIENYTRIVQLNGKGSITFQNKERNKSFFGRWTNRKIGLYYISGVSNASKIIQNILR